MKLGLTSEAKQKHMRVYAPFVAWLTDDMILNVGDPVPQAKLILRFRAGDVIADNASSGAWATGSIVVKPDDIDLLAEKVEVYVDSKLEHTGTGADEQGHPGEALTLAANDLARRSLAIEAGQMVLTGGITDAVFAPPGSTVTCKFSTLGEITIKGDN